MTFSSSISMTYLKTADTPVDNVDKLDKPQTIEACVESVDIVDRRRAPLPAADPTFYSPAERWPGDKGPDKNSDRLPYWVKDWQRREVFMVKVRSRDVPPEERTVMLWQKLGPHVDLMVDLDPSEVRAFAGELLKLADLCQGDDE